MRTYPGGGGGTHPDFGYGGSWGKKKSAPKRTNRFEKPPQNELTEFEKLPQNELTVFEKPPHNELTASKCDPKTNLLYRNIDINI